MEQRIINANGLKEYLKDMEVQTGKKCCTVAIKSCIDEFFPQVIDDQPTVDPETLPIAKQLRDEVKRVANERNSLAEIVLQGCNKACFMCDNGVIKPNGGCGWFNYATYKCKLLEWIEE